MTVAENAIVVDKNIWLDFYLHERPLHEEAARFIRVAEKYNANLGTPADAVNEVFYTVGRYLKQQVRENGGTVDECTARAINNFAWGCVDHMTDLAISVPMDDRTAWLARHHLGLRRRLGSCFLRIVQGELSGNPRQAPGCSGQHSRQNRHGNGRPHNPRSRGIASLTMRGSGCNFVTSCLVC